MAISNAFSSPKKRRNTKKKPPEADAIDIDADGPIVDPDSGNISIPLPDGSVEINLNPQPETIEKSTKFGDNLAEHLDSMILGQISQPLLANIEDDIQDRSEWLNQRADGMDQLGIKIEKPGGSVGSSSAPIDGMFRGRHPALMEAVLRGQANAYAELCPSDGPCKGVNFGAETTDGDKLAEDFEKDFNYYLTQTASEYYPDTRKMLGMTVYASGMFKKVYSCPIRRRPASESVDGADLIIPSNATDLKNAGRITHQIDMRQSVMRRMQILGVYRDVDLRAPSPEPNALQTKGADLSGFNINANNDEDQTYTVYECYCELDIPGYEHKEGNKITGLPLPYRVTIDKDSQTVLEIRRNWEEDDDDYVAQIPFVAFPYVTLPVSGFGIYGLGLLHIMGNTVLGLTAMLREGVDAGMFANFPGGLITKPATRQVNNEIRVAPGALAPVDIGSASDIRTAIMPLPYKDVTPGLLSLMQMMSEVAQRIGGTADSPVGEGKQDAPVGTTLAMIEQATKIEGGVHKSFHAAQAEELRLLRDLLRDDPEALWRGNKRPALGAIPQDADEATREQAKAARLARFKQALEDCEIVPASDPNVPSHMHRLAKAQTLWQMASTAPAAFQQEPVLRRILGAMKIDDPEAILAPAPTGPPPMDPIAQATLALKAQDIQTKQLQIASNVQKADKDRQSKESVEAMKLAQAHTAAMAGAQPNEQPVDPLQAQALQLKQQQVNQSGLKIQTDAHNAHLERQSKETIKAMDIAARLATHPESQPVVNNELSALSSFEVPATKAQGPSSPPMSEGGPVGMADGGPLTNPNFRPDRGRDYFIDSINGIDALRPPGWNIGDGRESTSVEDRRGEPEPFLRMQDELPKFVPAPKPPQTFPYRLGRAEGGPVAKMGAGGALATGNPLPPEEDDDAQEPAEDLSSLRVPGLFDPNARGEPILPDDMRGRLEQIDARARYHQLRDDLKTGGVALNPEDAVALMDAKAQALKLGQADRLRQAIEMAMRNYPPRSVQ